MMGLSFSATSEVLSWFAIAILAMAWAGTIRQVKGLQARQLPRALGVGPRLGSVAPSIDTVPFQADRPTFLLFADTECGACERVIPAFANASSKLEGQASFAVLFRSSVAAELNPFGTLHTAADQAQAFARYNVSMTPFGVLVGSDGRILDASPVGSPERLEQLVLRSREGVSR